MRETKRVIVIGGGISGLGAARELARHGCAVTLLEAGERLGGRIFTVKAAGEHQAIELGAEFVHGGNAQLRALFRRAGVKMRAVSRTMAIAGNGRLGVSRNYWKTIAATMNKIPAGSRASFAEFLRSLGETLSRKDRREVRDYAESFNAGPASRLSAAALRPEGGGAEQSQHRPVGGYGQIIEHLEKELRALKVTVLTKSRVSRVRWSAGRVRVSVKRARGRGDLSDYEADALVVTLPLGVLRAGAVRFSPALKEKRALVRKLGFGGVARITLQFDRAFWRRRVVATSNPAKRPGDFQFVRAPDATFPVWWVPGAGPFIVGWAGGPAAARLGNASEAGRRAAAVRSLAGIWGVAQKKLRAHLLGAWTHDWANDGDFRGAYSYAVAGQDEGAARLAEAVAGTLYFAGEATADEPGTVHGALASGIAAAKKIVAKGRLERSSSRGGA